MLSTNGLSSSIKKRLKDLETIALNESFSLCERLEALIEYQYIYGGHNGKYNDFHIGNQCKRK